MIHALNYEFMEDVYTKYCNHIYILLFSYHIIYFYRQQFQVPPCPSNIADFYESDNRKYKGCRA